MEGSIPTCIHMFHVFIMFVFFFKQVKDTPKVSYIAP
nr:MAG TPA: hypothetical protein [Crassvirales sp.]